jgi:hypothetical protein
VNADKAPSVKCDAKWLYRGRTRAKCHGEAGHKGKHWNHTVKWSDTTPGAERPDNYLAGYLDDEAGR